MPAGFSETTLEILDSFRDYNRVFAKFNYA